MSPAQSRCPCGSSRLASSPAPVATGSQEGCLAWGLAVGLPPGLFLVNSLGEDFVGLKYIIPRFIAEPRSEVAVDIVVSDSLFWSVGRPSPG